MPDLYQEAYREWLVNRAGSYWTLVASTLRSTPRPANHVGPRFNQRLTVLARHIVLERNSSA